MSSFGPKRKARIIQTFDDDGDDLTPAPNSGEEEQSDQSAPTGRIKFGRNKPGKSSALRKTVNVDQDVSSEPASAPPATSRHDDSDDDGSGGPVVVRPSIGRSGSTKVKKRPAASRVSFGPGEAADEEEAAGVTRVSKPFTPKKPLGQRLLETNALRKTASLQNLPSGLPMRFGGQDEGPKYNKEYLEELQSSTPNTPQNLAELQVHDDEMELDEAELDGALVVQPTTSQVAPYQAAAAPGAHILTEAEIRERKDRRARLAKEAEFISLGDDGDGDESDQDAAGRKTVNFPTKKKDSRLMAEDEDLGEGYDEFVSDGGLALGKKAEREAARRHRQEMADLIKAAEVGSDAESDDSEAERRAAYEAAQRRAGLDGLHVRDHGDDGDAADPDAIPRMKPLPKLGEVLQRMRELVQGIEDEVAQRRARIGGLEREKEEILAREKEVQEILNQAGAKYQAVVGGGTDGSAADVAKLVARSPLVPVERGLESFGATPTRREDADEMA